MGSGRERRKDGMLTYKTKVRTKATVAISLNNWLQKDDFCNFCMYGTCLHLFLHLQLFFSTNHKLKNYFLKQSQKPQQHRNIFLSPLPLLLLFHKNNPYQQFTTDSFFMCSTQTQIEEVQVGIIRENVYLHTNIELLSIESCVDCRVSHVHLYRTILCSYGLIFQNMHIPQVVNHPADIFLFFFFCYKQWCNNILIYCVYQ